MTDSKLSGISLALTNNISIIGVETTCASKMLAGYKPAFNATIVDKIEQAGMIIKGKLEMEEFGAAAISVGPNFGGATMIKPTYGAVSRYGIISGTSSIGQIEITGQNIEDCASLLSVISGPDPKDSTCVIKKPFKFENFAKHGISGFKIGVSRDFFDPAIPQKFKSAGAEIEEFEMPLAEYMAPAHYIIACAEASSNMARYDGLKYGHRAEVGNLADVYRLSRSEGFGYDIKKRIMLGSFFLSSGFYDDYYGKAMKIRALVKDNFNRIFEKYDMLLSPVREDVYTLSASLAGLPVAALPCGFQLIGDAFSEEKLINAVRVYQTGGGV